MTEVFPAGARLVFFGGKGGVGKSSCAAAAAIAWARRHPERRVLLLSTDPAHSLGDVLASPGGDSERPLPKGPKNLFLRELDAPAELERRREDYQQAVSELFDALRGGSRFDITYDRRIIEDLIDLAPPGIDELFALLSVMETLVPTRGRARYDLLVVDTAPTGHTLRLLELPAQAQEWTRAMIGVLHKYRGVVAPGRLARELVETSQQLRAFRELLADPARTRFVVVTRAAELPLAETARLVSALRRLRVPEGGLIVNALTPAPPRFPKGPARCGHCRRDVRRESAALESLTRSRALRALARAVIFAPAIAPPPRGVAALERWNRSWKHR